ncbi:MAG TPA: hypothetical protein VGI17_11970 [Solirubrobacterales bacterium]|jgi:hypothetical protein
MEIEEVGVRIDYFHDASDSYLSHLGIDRALPPDRTAWRAFYEEEMQPSTINFPQPITRWVLERPSQETRESPSPGSVSP